MLTVELMFTKSLVTIEAWYRAVYLTLILKLLLNYPKDDRADASSSNMSKTAINPVIENVLRTKLEGLSSFICPPHLRMLVNDLTRAPIPELSIRLILAKFSRKLREPSLNNSN